MRVALLWLAGAVISGFTLRRHLGPLDEGILMQAATRMADGQWPWRDFSWAYGPGEPLAVMAAGKLLGPSLLWWRLLRVAADATVAVLVWGLVREARPRWAPVAWAAAAVTAAQPTSANPTQPALAFALAATLLAVRGRPGWAGLAAAAAAFWRPDVGAAAALAAAVALVVARRGRRAAGACVATALVAGVLLYAPFLAASGPAHVWQALVVDGTQDGAWWRLPFPSGYPGQLRAWPPAAAAADLKDLLGWLAPYGALLALVLAFARPRPVAPLLVLGVAATVYFLSRADLEHAQMLVLVGCTLAALARPRPVMGAVLALLLVTGVANRASALLRGPHLRVLQLPGAGGVRVPARDAAALPALARTVQRLVPPGRPIYVAPRRSDLVTFNNPLLHFLVRRPNVLHRDVLLQARPDEQARIVIALRRTRPRVVVRWTAPESARSEPNRRGRPSGSRALDAYLAGAYVRTARYGDYDVLVPR